MANNFTEAQINEIVASVLKQLNTSAPAAAKQWDATQYAGRKLIGIYADMNDAIAAASEGYKTIRAMSVAQREKLITVIREMTREEAPIMAALGVAETGMGRVDHKTAKHNLVADKTPGTEDIEPSVRTGDGGLTLTEMAPFGVVGSITPSTNP
ncbi:MAG: aldehyde dehydrogenase family protein, partial [Clostridia bacterium]|nr:aldehyde dehydrogenase family protein [Clostridia bacterium]